MTLTAIGCLVGTFIIGEGFWMALRLLKRMGLLWLEDWWRKQLFWGLVKYDLSIKFLYKHL